MKKFLIVLTIILVTMFGVSFNNNTISFGASKAYALMDYPSCIVNVSSKVRIGKTAKGYVYCVGKGPLTTNITKSSFRVDNTRKINITKVYEPKYSENSVKVEFSYKAKMFGTTTINLLPNCVFDKNGIGNTYSGISPVKVTLFG